jgi:hypothetical protein
MHINQQNEGRTTSARARIPDEAAQHAHAPATASLSYGPLHHQFDYRPTPMPTETKVPVCEGCRAADAKGRTGASKRRAAQDQKDTDRQKDTTSTRRNTRTYTHDSDTYTRRQSSRYGCGSTLADLIITEIQLPESRIDHQCIRKSLPSSHTDTRS